MWLKVLTKSECCFCLISVARNVARTPPPVNKSSTFQIHQRVTEKRKRIFTDNKHTMETSHQMCRTRDRTASRVRGKDQHLFAPHKVRGETQHFFAPRRVRGEQDQASLVLRRGHGWIKQRILHSSKCTRDTGSHCSECADTNLFSAESSGNGAIYQDTEHNTKEDDNG